MFGKRVRAIIECEDGTSLEMIGVTADLQFEQPRNQLDLFAMPEIGIFSPRTVTLTIVGTNATMYANREQFNLQLQIRKQVPEWKCDYCGQVHPRTETECRKCGAPRSFVYD